jgi:hypothetical protein
MKVKGMSKLGVSSRGVTTVVLRHGLAVVSVAIALGLALLAQSQGMEKVNAIKELGIFWAVINEPPPGSMRKKDLS